MWQWVKKNAKVVTIATVVAAAAAVYFPVAEGQDWPPFGGESVGVTPTQRSSTAAAQTSVLADLAASLFNPAGREEPSKEYVCILNRGERRIDMLLWRLHDRQEAVFTFPDFSLAPGGKVRVRSGTGVDSVGDLYARKDHEVWDDDGDSVVIFARDRDGTYRQIFADHYGARDDGEYTGRCDPQLTQGIGLWVADFQQPDFKFVSPTGAELSFVTNEPRVCSFSFNCAKITYSRAEGERSRFALVPPEPLSLTAQKALCVEARGSQGGEALILTRIGRAETTTAFARLTRDWMTINVSLAGIPERALKEASFLEFAVSSSHTDGAIFLQRIYGTAEGFCGRVGELVRP